MLFQYIYEFSYSFCLFIFALENSKMEQISKETVKNKFKIQKVLQTETWQVWQMHTIPLV